MPDPSRPVLLFYCQHSLGIGHLTRSFALVAALADAFQVVFLNGGRLPAGVVVPRQMTIIHLPPLGMDDGHTIVSRDGAFDVEAARAERRRLIEAAVREWRPAVLLVELFPFGRKKFAGEILPLIRLARQQEGTPALVACSLRDILVDARPDQQRHDDRARWLTDRYFDVVLVHSDPAVARIEESFRPTRALRTAVHYSGFVVPARAHSAPALREDHLLVSAGGGIVGGELLKATLRAWRSGPTGLRLRMIAGPFLPEAEWRALGEEVAGQGGVDLLRHVPDMVAEMRRARASVSQCGYNTALDIVVAEVPALVVPYETATENEQVQRAQRLSSLGLVKSMRANTLTPEILAEGIRSLLAFRPAGARIRIDGAAHSAEILHRLHAARRFHHSAPWTQARAGMR